MPSITGRVTKADASTVNLAQMQVDPIVFRNGVIFVSGATVTFTTSNDGSFDVVLSPGTYRLRRDTNHLFNFTVPDGDGPFDITSSFIVKE